MPQMIPEQLLRAEGFTEIRFVEMIAPEVSSAVGLGKVDFDMHFAPQWVSVIDGSAPVTVLSGVHVGCVELFGKEGIRSIADLKGKTVGIAALGSPDHLFVSVMVAHIGLDPANDIHWVTAQSPTPAEQFAGGTIDAFLGFPPLPQELRARNLKTTDLCASDPASVARQLVDRGFAQRYDYALQTLNDNPYDKWREYDPEDTLRFYALRMREVGRRRAREWFCRRSKALLPRAHRPHGGQRRR